MKQIDCRAISDCDDPVLERIKNTYINSFPEEERRDFSLFCKLHKENDKFHVYAAYRDNQYAGFITSWNLDGFTYIEHFAIDPEMRNGGIGGKVMDSFFSLYNVPLVLEVEKPEDEMSQRRIGFYERLGFKLDDHPYKQPPYRIGSGWIDMLLMSKGSIDLNNHFENIKEQLYKNVYNVENKKAE